MTRLLLRDVEVDGVRTDVLIVDGRVATIARGLATETDTIDGRGGALIPGLVDHHIHLLASAAAIASIDLADCPTLDAVSARIRSAAADRGPGAWLRAIACPAAIAERLDRDTLDRIAPAHRLRVLDRTGALWVLNGAALAGIGEIAGLERDPAGRATGRLWRGDAALGAALRATDDRVDLPLAALGRRLASYGVTGVTDTSETTDATAAALLAGAMPQRLTLMSGGPLEIPADRAFTVGAVKIVPDERDLPSLDEVVERIAMARDAGRAVAVHCVTATELALTLAAFQTAGSRPGDRIEHGSVMPWDAIPIISGLGLAVVTQPGFVTSRGDAYRRDVAAVEQDDLYRCASLIAGHVAVAGSSDGPYGPLDPWLGMRAATDRRTVRGKTLGANERIDGRAALGLYLGRQDRPGGAPRRVRGGAPADICLLDVALSTALVDLDSRHVAKTLIGGERIWER